MKVLTGLGPSGGSREESAPCLFLTPSGSFPLFLGSWLHLSYLCLLLHRTLISPCLPLIGTLVDHTESIGLIQDALHTQEFKLNHTRPIPF